MNENAFGTGKLNSVPFTVLNAFHPRCHFIPNEIWLRTKRKVRGMFEMNCLFSYISISTWGTIKKHIYISRFIQGLHDGV